MFPRFVLYTSFQCYPPIGSRAKNSNAVIARREGACASVLVNAGNDNATGQTGRSGLPIWGCPVLAPTPECAMAALRSIESRHAAASKPSDCRLRQDHLSFLHGEHAKPDTKGLAARAAAAMQVSPSRVLSIHTSSIPFLATATGSRAASMSRVQRPCPQEMATCSRPQRKKARRPQLHIDACQLQR